MSVETISALCTIVALLAVIGRWVMKVDANTQATERLTRAFEAFTVKIEATLFDHERRISHLEGSSQWIHEGSDSPRGGNQAS